MINLRFSFDIFLFSVSKKWKTIMQDPILWEALDMRNFEFSGDLKAWCNHLSRRLSAHQHSRPVTTVRLTWNGIHAATNMICRAICDNCPYITEMLYDIPTNLFYQGPQLLPCISSTKRIIINGDPKYHYEHKFQLSLHHVWQPALETSHATVQHFELCGVATSMDTLRIISRDTLVQLHLRWPFFYSNSDFFQFLEYIADRYVNLESLVISWPHYKFTDLDRPQLDYFITKLGTATQNLIKLVLRGFDHVNQRLLDESFRQFTIEATNLQVLQFDDCEFVDDVAVQAIAMNVTQLTDLSISVMNCRPRVTDLGFQTLVSCQDLQRLDISGQVQISAGVIEEVVSSLPHLRQVILPMSLSKNPEIRKFKRSRRNMIAFR